MGRLFASNGHDLDDTAAIHLALTGDHKAFGELVGRYKHMVHTIAFRVLRNSMDAQDVTQDIFVKVYQKLNEFQGNGKFSTWLYSVAYRMSISFLRSRKTTDSSIEDLQYTGKEPAADERPWDDKRKFLEQGLRAIDPEDATILSLFYLEELSIDEIVTVTELSASNVKVKLHRSRKKLHDELHDQLKDEIWTLTDRT